MSQQVQEKYEESHLYKIRHSAAHIMAHLGRGVTVDVIVPNASPIKSIADLKGKKVGTFAGAAGTATVLFRVIASKFHGFDPGKTGDLQFAGPGLLPALLDKGEIEAAVMFDPLAAKLEVSCSISSFTPLPSLICGVIFKFVPTCSRWIV